MVGLLARESKVDVLVIGAGPAGLMASTAFAQAGVNFRVIDKRPKHVAAGQADGIQPRTIEVFQVSHQPYLLLMCPLCSIRTCLELWTG